MNVSLPFIQRPIATTLLSIGIFLVGAVAYAFLPVAALPNVEYPTIRVSASRPGADPSTMAATVAAPLERRLGEIPGVVELTSTSSLGTASISVQFDISRKIDSAARDVQAALNAAVADLPGDLPNLPSFRKANPNASPIFILALTSNIRPPSAIYDVADTVIAQRLSQIDGVAEANVSGAEQPAIRVRVNPVAIASMGINLEDVRLAIVNANAAGPLGAFDSDGVAEVIGTNTQMRDPRQYRDIVVKSANGAVTLLGSIATIEQSTRNSRGAAWFNRQPAILINVTKQAGANVIETVDRIQALLPELKRWVPPDIVFSVLSDRTLMIRASVRDMQLTLGATVLHGDARGVRVSAPVDADHRRRGHRAAVARRNLRRHVARRIFDRQPVADGARGVGRLRGRRRHRHDRERLPQPGEGIFAGPRRGRRRGADRLHRDLHQRFADRGLHSAAVHERARRAAVPRILGDAGVRDRDLDAGLAVGHADDLRPLCAGGAEPECHLVRPAGGRRAGADAARLQPQPRRRAAPSHPHAGGARRDRRADGQPLRQHAEGLLPAGRLRLRRRGRGRRARHLVPGDGRAAAACRRHHTGGPGGRRARLLGRRRILERRDQLGQLFISLKPRAERDGLSTLAVVERIRASLEGIPGLRVYIWPAEQLPNVGGRQSRSQYQFTLIDADAEELDIWVPRVQERIRRIPGIIDVTTDREQGGLQANVVIDRTAASRLGVKVQDIDNALNNSFSQRQISTIFTQRNQYRVILEIDPQHRRDPSDIDHVYVAGAGGTQVPLSAVARLTKSNTPLSVNHQGQYPAVTITYNLAADIALETAANAVLQAVAEMHLPDTLRTEFAGDMRVFAESAASEEILILAALIGIYIVLGVLYESLAHPLTIISTLPSAGLGALLALAAFGAELSIIAFIGIILLIGIVKKNGIMLVDFAVEGERRGLSPDQAIHEACLHRFRPILMTTMSALLGAVPLLIATGTGAELRRPLGMTIIGGLAVSQILTLYTTPVIYLLLDRLHLPAVERDTADQARPGAAGVPAE